MERFVDLSLADVGRTVYRYRPVVAAAAAIVVLGLALPSPQQAASNLAQFATGSSPARPATQSPAPSVEEIVPEVAVESSDDGASTAGLTTGSGSFDSGASSFDSGAGRSATFDAGTSDPSPPAQSDSTTSSGSSATPPPVESTRPSTAPAKASITTTLYASRTAGTPLAAEGVPAKSLPVGTRVGQEDKVSFIRLSKPIDRLVLKTIPEGDRQPATGAIRMCLVKTTGWSAGEAIALADAPERDCTVSVLGVRADDGSWSFDLRPFEGRPGDGFSLAPAAGAGVDFQVAFEATLP